MALGGMVSTAQRALGIILLGSLAFKVQYAVGDFWQLLLVFFLAMTALYGMGMMAASLFLLLSREAWHIANLAQEPIYLAAGFYFPIKSFNFWVNLAQEPIYLAAGFYFPIKSFNFWVAAAASIIPLTLGLDAMRQLVFPSGALLGFLTVRTEISILVGLSVVFIAAARIMLAKMESLAIREGRLTESRR